MSINTVRPDHKVKEHEKDYSLEKHLSGLTHQNALRCIVDLISVRIVLGQQLWGQLPPLRDHYLVYRI
jgi:hypothetical protein